MKTTEWKDTEIGRIPKDWEVKPIGEIFTFKNGLNKGKEFFGEGTPIINYTDVYHKRSLVAKDIKGKVTLSSDEIKRFEVKKGDMFFTRTSETPEEVGIASVLLEDIPSCVFSGFVLRARPINDSLFPDDCGYGFSTKQIRKDIVNNCTFTTRALTNGQVLSSIKIPLLPISEQQRIAKALSDIDMLIASLDKAIEKKRLVKQGAMQQLLTGKKRLKGFTGEWKKVKWSDLGYFVSGNTFTLRYQGVKRETYPFYKVSDMNNWGNENYMLRSNNYISEKTAKELSCNIIPADAIVFAKIGAAIFLERKRYTRKPCCIDNNMMAYIPMGVAKLFIWKLLETIKFGDYVDATALPSLSPITLGKITFYIPQDIVEQQEIANVLSMIDGEISSLTHEREKYLRLKDGMMQELLTGKTRLI